jgi:hypothetical protein
MHSARSDGRSRGGQGGHKGATSPDPRRRLAVTHGRRRVVGWTSTDLDYFGSGITDLPSWYSARLFVNGFVNGTPREAIERVRQTVTGDWAEPYRPTSESRREADRHAVDGCRPAHNPAPIGNALIRSGRTGRRRITRGPRPCIHGVTCTDSTTDGIRSTDCTGISRPPVPRPVPRTRDGHHSSPHHHEDLADPLTWLRGRARPGSCTRLGHRRMVCLGGLSSMARDGLLLAAFRGDGRASTQDCLRSVIQVNGWMAPAGVRCSSRSRLTMRQLAPS